MSIRLPRLSLCAALLASPLPACVDAADDLAEGPDAGAEVDAEAATDPEAPGGAIFLTNVRPRTFYGLAPADYDGDGRTDVGLRLDNGNWYVDLASNGFGSHDAMYGGFGTRDDQPVPADHDGDGRADLALFKIDGTWQIDYSNNGFGSWDFELPYVGGDPVPADYDGDGRADLGARVTSTGRWWIDYAANGLGVWDGHWAGYGGNDGVAVPADYDGDGRADLAIREDSGWWRIDHAADGFGVWNVSYPGYGTSAVGMIPVAADFDGDGRADLSVRSTSGLWYIDYSSNGFGAFQAWPAGYGGTVASQPVVGDYDGDGRDDLAIKDQCGSWNIDLAAGGFGAWNQSATWMSPLPPRVVTTATDLVAALGTDFIGEIRAWNPAGIDLTAYPYLEIPGCARLTGYRNGLDPGTLLHTSNTTSNLFTVRSDRVRIDHIRLRGPSTSSSDDAPNVIGIYVQGGFDFELDHAEISAFPRAAVDIHGRWDRMTRTSGFARIHDNYLHHNQKGQFGYGVAVGHHAWAVIEQNVFAWHRHGITHDGRVQSGYLAYRNYFLEGTTGYNFWNYYGPHMDVHGDAEDDDGHGGNAGEYFEIGWNTLRGEQAPLPSSWVRAALRVRGVPTDRIDFHHNVVVHDAENAVDEWDGAVINVWDNAYDTDHTLDLGAGDFDGDGITDVFLGTGVTWWYSSAGVTEWRYLNQAVDRASQLGFARVDGDNKTDLISRGGDGNLYYSSGGSGPWTYWTTSPYGIVDLRFFDFTGDGRADIFRTSGTGQWSLWDSGTGSWRTTQSASIPISMMRFGEFDATPGTDLLAKVGANWLISSGAQTVWSYHDVARVSDLRITVAADFDGDGKTDLAWRSGNTWRYLRSGRGTLLTLRTITPMASCERQVIGGNPSHQASCPSYPELTTAVIGDFDGTGDADVINVERKLAYNYAWAELPALHLAGWTGSGDRFVRRSYNEMR